MRLPAPQASARGSKAPDRPLSPGGLGGWGVLLLCAAAFNVLGLGDAVAATERAIEMVDLADAAERKVGTYSKGMRQRIKVAAARRGMPASRASATTGPGWSLGRGKPSQPSE
mgnify:CR=1 FL=1